MEETAFRFTKDSVYAYQVMVDGQVQNDVKVGDLEFVDALVQVGRGQAVHRGSERRMTVTTAFSTIRRGYVNKHFTPGDDVPFEPFPDCSSHSYYSGGMRGRNKAVTGVDVTCKKCLAK